MTAFAVMKRGLTILFSIIALKTFSQQAVTDFTEIDRKVQFIKPASPEVLAIQLTSFCVNDIEKVRSIFRWITGNISYQTKQPPNRKGIPVAEDDSLVKSLDERIAGMVLKRGYAVCDGYARLFKTLCAYAGIRSEIISGYGRVNTGTRRFGNNHSWNAVMINNEWRLLDVTWASGFMSWKGDVFIRQFDETYFLTPPRKFITEHFPDDRAWILMDNPPLMNEFRHSPFKQKTFSKYRIKIHQPSGGIIEVSKGDTIKIELETADAEKDRTIGAEPFLDLNAYTTPTSVLLSPSSVALNKISYNYCLTSSDIEWLYIQYNNDVIMRYRLTVRNKKSSKELVSR